MATTDTVTEVVVIVDRLIAVTVDVLVDVSVVLMPDSYTVVEANSIVSTTKRPINTVLTFNLFRRIGYGESFEALDTLLAAETAERACNPQRSRRLSPPSAAFAMASSLSTSHLAAWRPWMAPRL